MKYSIGLTLVFLLVGCSQNQILDEPGNGVSSNKIKNINGVSNAKSNGEGDSIGVSNNDSGINFKKQ